MTFFDQSRAYVAYPSLAATLSSFLCSLGGNIFRTCGGRGGTPGVKLSDIAFFVAIVRRYAQVREFYERI
jgi:hypothetical protein